jgi:hypothetical protein
LTFFVVALLARDQSEVEMPNEFEVEMTMGIGARAHMMNKSKCSKRIN